MNRETVEYVCGDTKCRGYFVYNEIVDEPRPGVLLVPAWMGQDDFIKEKADAVARLGYVAFVADIYGNGKCVDTEEAASALMVPLFIDRQLLRDRVSAGLQALKKQRQCNGHKTGAIGFCFGGLTVIELLRSGVDVKGVVSFHGLLGNTLGNNVAVTVPDAEKMKGALLILHGNEDPLVSAEDIKSVQKEFSDANIDWQMYIYGHAVHAFTNPAVHDKSRGLAFDERASKRSWQAMINFFKEILS